MLLVRLCDCFFPGSLYAVNNSLHYWDASLGSSYMCRKEETLNIAEGYRIKTFDLRVQPFDVKENKYATGKNGSPGLGGGRCHYESLLFLLGAKADKEPPLISLTKS